MSIPIPRRGVDKKAFLFSSLNLGYGVSTAIVIGVDDSGTAEVDAPEVKSGGVDGAADAAGMRYRAQNWDTS